MAVLRPSRGNGNFVAGHQAIDMDETPASTCACVAIYCGRPPTEAPGDAPPRRTHLSVSLYHESPQHWQSDLTNSVALTFPLL